jgi:hypothetical protein
MHAVFGSSGERAVFCQVVQNEDRIQLQAVDEWDLDGPWHAGSRLIRQRFPGQVVVLRTAGQIESNKTVGCTLICGTELPLCREPSTAARVHNPFAAARRRDFSELYELTIRTFEP